MADTPSGANAPYKLQKRGEKWAVVNNIGETKALFDSRDKALAYQRALYVSVPGAAKRADKVKFTGDARQRIPKEKSMATMIDGDETNWKDLAAATDATLDSAQMLIQGNDVSALPGWAQQVCSLTLAAGATIDIVMQIEGIPDPDESEKAYLIQQAKDFSTGARDQLAKSGAALPDGSFPIVTTGDLRNALHAIGRAKDVAKAKAHIIARAKALGATAMLPDGWKA